MSKIQRRWFERGFAAAIDRNLKGCKFAALAFLLGCVASGLLMTMGGTLGVVAFYVSLAAAVFGVPVGLLLTILCAIRSTDEEVGPRE